MKTKEKLVAIMITAVLVGFMSPVHGDIVLGEWGFNEGSGTTAADSSTPANNGTLTNGAGWTGSTGGRSGGAGDYALSLDGTDDYVSVPQGDPYPTNLKDPKKDVTLEMWLKPTEGVAERSRLISKYWSYTLEYERKATGTDLFYFSVRLTSGAVTHSAHIETGTHLSTTEWTYVKAVYDSTLGTDTMRVYYGADEASAVRALYDDTYKKDDTADIHAGNNHQLGIGTYITSAGTPHTSEGCYFGGHIDDVKISMVPEPATMSLLLLGLPFALRRKR